MLRKLLIANRGEIACRIIRTARRLGVTTVLAVSEADERSLAAAQADEVVLVGPSPATDSYLRGDRIIEAARRTGADAIHPGYGFLSENADFAEAVTHAGLIFVGPTPAAMRALGAKSAAKRIAIANAIPVVPGYQGDAQDEATLAAEARRIGWPVLIKAVDGGGGRGMRLVERAADFGEALSSARREAAAAFGSDRVLIEKLIERPRHVEVQVFGDAHGNVVHMFERDCSLQRRNQKVIEEAPAPGMSPGLRQALTDAAVRLAKAVGYRGAGTVEFLIEGGALSDRAPWYFIEMNTRLQVEHPVTEEITGLDLVEWQLRVAGGEPLPLIQDEIAMHGHAIEVRVCAEDPAKGFLPSVGRIAAFDPAELQGLRVETGVETGGEVSPYYDSMIAKLIAHAADRAGALDLAQAALAETALVGPRSNMGFLHALLGAEPVRTGLADTGFIGRELERLTRQEPLDPRVWRAGIDALLDLRHDDVDRGRRANAEEERRSPWSARDGFQLGGERRITLDVLADGERQKIDVAWTRDGLVAALHGSDAGPGGATHAGRRPVAWQCGDRVYVTDRFNQVELRWPLYDAAADDSAGGHDVRAPINGRVAKVLVAPADAVEKGARMAIIEAMKMEHVLVAPRAGTVAKVAVTEGEQVTQGALIAALQAETSS